MEYNCGIEIPEAWMPMTKKYKQQDNRMTADNWRKLIAKTVRIEMFQL